MRNTNSDIRLNRLLIAFFITTSVAFGTYFYLTPYVSILSFRNYMLKNDYDKAGTYINFSQVRKSIKIQLRNSFAKLFFDDLSENPLTPLGIIIINPLIGGIVDSTVTPYGLKVLLSQGKLLSPGRSITLNVEENNNKLTKQRIKLYYSGINSFTITNKFI